jgi:hypothetical protein
MGYFLPKDNGLTKDFRVAPVTSPLGLGLNFDRVLKFTIGGKGGKGC